MNNKYILVIIIVIILVGLYMRKKENYHPISHLDSNRLNLVEACRARCSNASEEIECRLQCANEMLKEGGPITPFHSEEVVGKLGLSEDRVSYIEKSPTVPNYIPHQRVQEAYGVTQSCTDACDKYNSCKERDQCKQECYFSKKCLKACEGRLGGLDHRKCLINCGEGIPPLAPQKYSFADEYYGPECKKLCSGYNKEDATACLSECHKL